MRVPCIACQLRGFPCPAVFLHTHSTFSQRQQIGRAGRRARDSLAIYVAEETGLDSHYVAYPDDLFDKPTADLIVNLENPLIIEAHLQCAAFEMPLSGDDTCWFGPSTTELCETKLVRDKEGWYVDLNLALLTKRCRDWSLGSTRTQSICLILPPGSPSGGPTRTNIS
jgi:hypothetical protein